VHPVADQRGEFAAAADAVYARKVSLPHPCRPKRHERTARSTDHPVLGDALSRCEVPADEVARAVTGARTRRPLTGSGYLIATCGRGLQRYGGVGLSCGHFGGCQQRNAVAQWDDECGVDGAGLVGDLPVGEGQGGGEVGLSAT